LYEERRKRDAQRIGDVVNQLMARQGYGQIVGSEQIRTAWKDIAGPLGTHSVPGNLKRGVLEVFVRNSAVMQELTFQKRQLLVELAEVFNQQTIEDLRFRVGTID
jgi:predicted nucleic acid-binding Zn ribbon protein